MHAAAAAIADPQEQTAAISWLEWITEYRRAIDPL